MLIEKVMEIPLFEKMMTLQFQRSEKNYNITNLNQNIYLIIFNNKIMKNRKKKKIKK